MVAFNSEKKSSWKIYYYGSALVLESHDGAGSGFRDVLCNEDERDELIDVLEEKKITSGPDARRELVRLRERRPRCPDCGEVNQRRGHQECMYPSDYD